MGRPDQAQVALVDEIRERNALVLVLLRHRNHEAEIGAHQLVQRLLIAFLDELGQPDLLLTVDEGVGADLFQILVE